MPKAKTVEKKETSKPEKKTKIVIATTAIEEPKEVTLSKSPRIQTAEGWKRSMLKAKSKS
jgi:hypothetical protein